MASELTQEKHSRLGVLVCGQTGVGKSSLVNSLLGYNVCSVGDPGGDDCKKTFSPDTWILPKEEANINGTIVTIWDSPGLQDGTVDEERYLQEMYDKCRDVDLVLYCVEMTTVRWTGQEKRAVTLLTKKFGECFWEKCVVVLTKANMVRVPREERNDKRAYHKRLYSNFVHKLREMLREQSIPKRVYFSLNAVAAGLVENDYDEEDQDAYNDRYLWYVSERRKQSTGKQDFIAELWVTVFEVLKRNQHSHAKFMNITDSSRMDIAEDARISNPRLAKKLSAREVESGSQQLDQTFDGVSIPHKKQCSNFRLDAEHLKRIETSTSARWLVFGIAAGAASGAAVAGYFGGMILIGGIIVGGALGVMVVRKISPLSL